MLTAKKQIAIVGGGPGGLTLARLLQQQGATVKVYERDLNADVRVQGATLDLHHESGLKALEKAGLLNAFKKHYRPGADKMRVTNNQADVLYDQHLEESTEDFGNAYFRPEIDRGPFRKILLASLQPNTVVWDSQLLALEPAGQGWTLVFKNGTTAQADIVVGADGANSKVRAFITDIQPFYAGLTVVEGNVPDAEVVAPHMHALVRGGKIFALGNEKTLIVSAKGDGSLTFYTGCNTPESWAQENGIDFKDRVQALTWFAHTFPEWSNVWHELFAGEKTYFVVRPQYCMPLDQSWKPRANITMLGDAAHLMPPYAGEGVNMALQDALELSECLANETYTDIQAAIAAYETGMRARASAVAQMTLEQTEQMHSTTGLEHILEMFNV